MSSARDDDPQAASAAAERLRQRPARTPPFTTRHAPAAMARANRLARLQTLYLAAQGPQRPGEPLNVLLIELAPHGSLDVDAPMSGVQREWLVLRGGLTLADARGAVGLAALDFHLAPADPQATAQRLDASADGALLFLREARHPAAPGAKPRTVRDADTPWQPFAPRIERRVLWNNGPLAALLYRAAPGARVPRHRHGHDEECLVLRGETLQDECLLREGDYQLAPAGTTHLSGATDAGAIFYIHGDLQLDVIGPGA